MTKRTPNHSAAGSAAGILFQFERVLLHLSTMGAKDIVAIETEDDVVKMLENGEIALEQDKHSVKSSGHPFADTSKDLWKTLLIWLELTEDKFQRISELNLVTNRPVPDCLARRLSEAKDDTSVEQCLKELKDIAKNPSKTIEGFANKLLEFDEDKIRKVIKLITLVDENAGTSREEQILKIFSALHIPTTLISKKDVIVDSLRGWIIDCAVKQWNDKQPALIHRQAFTNQYDAVKNSLERKRVISRAELAIKVSSDQIESARQNHFVDHLALIKVDDGTVDEAIEDYLRFKIERFRLEQEGEIPLRAWQEREHELVRYWKIIFRKQVLQQNDVEHEIVGQNILYDTMLHKQSLSGYEQDSQYFTSGHYHQLADIDQVWWHPDFKKNN